MIRLYGNLLESLLGGRSTGFSPFQVLAFLSGRMLSWSGRGWRRVFRLFSSFWGTPLCVRVVDSQRDYMSRLPLYLVTQGISIAISI